MDKKINVRFIIQIAGKPKDNVEKALDIVLDKLKENKDFKVLESEIVEPEYDENTTLYSGFIEILIKFEEISQILAFIVDYTPNSIEIEDPVNLDFTANELTGILNDMTSRLIDAQNEIRQLRAHIHNMNDKNKS